MSPVGVSTGARLEEVLREELGFTRTPMSTETGVYWVCNRNKRHLQVPFFIEGFCPDWMWQDVMKRARMVQQLAPRVHN